MVILRRLYLLFVALILPATVLCYHRPQLQRRQALRRLVLSGGVFAAAAAAVSTSSSPPAHAIIGSKGCYQGQGDGCSDLAGDSELIKSLQEKSAANRARNEKVGRDW